MCFKFTDWSKGLLLLIFILLRRYCILKRWQTISQSQRHIDARFIWIWMLLNNFQMVTYYFLILLQTVHLFLNKCRQIVILILFILIVLQLNSYLKVFLLQVYILLFDLSQFLCDLFQFFFSFSKVTTSLLQFNI